MATRHLTLLLKIRLRSLFNSAWKTKASRRAQVIFTALAFLTLIVSLFALFGEIFTTLSANGKLAPLLQDTVLGLAFLGFFIFMLVSGATMAIHYLFVSSDLPLLLSSPISLRAIFNYKLSEAIIANSGFFLFAGLPAFIMYGVTVHAAWYYYPFMLITAFIFLALPVSLSFLGALLIVRFIPPRRAREIMAILLALISFAIWASLQMFRSDSLRPGSENFNPQTIEALTHISHHPLYYLLPSTWAAKSLTGFATHSLSLILTNFVPLVLIFYIIYHFVIKLSYKAFNSGVLSSPETATIKRKKKRQKQTELNYAGNHRGKSLSTILAVFRRDWKMFFRDSRQVANQLLLTGMLIFLPLLHKSGIAGVTNILSPYLKIVFFSALISVSMSSRLIPIEEKAFWITKLIPRHQRYPLLGKFLLSFLINAFSVVVAVAVVGLYFKHPLHILIAALLSAVILSLSFTAVGLFAGAQFGTFDWENPKRMLSQSGSFLMLLITLVVVAVLGGVGVLSYLFGNWLQISIWAVIIFGGLFELIISFLLATALINLSAKKLERMEWQF